MPGADHDKETRAPRGVAIGLRNSQRGIAANGGFLSTLNAGRLQSGGVQVGAPRSHTAQTLAVRAAGMSCFQARKNLKNAKSHGPQPRGAVSAAPASLESGFP